MHWIDALVIAAYLLATLALGVWLARRVHDQKDFFLAGRKLPFWAIGMSLVVSDIGALEMIGGTAGAFRHGVTQANYEWIGCVPAMVVGGIVVVPLFWRLGIYSVPEYLGRRYGQFVRFVMALVAVTFMAAALGVFFEAAATMCDGVFGWDRWMSIAGIAAIVGVYTVGGGLGAVVVTDVVQCTILFIGGLALAGIGLVEVGGFSGLLDRLEAMGEPTRYHLELLQPIDLRDAAGEPTGYPWSGILLGLGLVLSPAYWFGNQAIIQRTLGARDEWHARASMVFGAALKTLVPFAFVLPGLLGVVLLQGRSGIEPNGVYPTLIVELLPVGLRGLLYAAFLAALMSSVDSYTNSAATMVAHDLLGRRLHPSRLLLVGRIASVATIALGVALVPVVQRFDTIYDAFQTFLSFFQGPTLALLVGGILWRGATPAGGVAALVGGIAVAIALQSGPWLFGFEVQYLHVAFWSFVAAVALLVAGSQFGSRLPAQELGALVYRSGAQQGVE